MLGAKRGHYAHNRHSHTNERTRHGQRKTAQWFGENSTELTQTGTDAWVLLEWLKEQPEALREAPKSHLLGRVFEGQFEVVEQKVQARKSEIAGGVKNPHDPETQWASKSPDKKKAWVGYKVHVMETVPEEGPRKKKGEPTEQFIAEVCTTEAVGSDLAGMKEALQAQQEYQEDQPDELYVDTAYVSDDSLRQSEEQGMELVGPARPPGNPAGLFSAEAFEVNIAQRQAVCPGGHISTQCSLINDTYNQSRYYRFEWGSPCDSCSLQSQCTKRKDGRRHLSVGVHHDRLQQRRKEMKTEAFKARMNQRAGIEGTISELMRRGMRRSRYRGLAKTALANYFIAAGCNLNRWFRLIEYEFKPAMAA